MNESRMTKKNIVEALSRDSFAERRRRRREALALPPEDSLRALLLEISRCPIAELTWANAEDEYGCATIVSSQKTGRSNFHTPEPWSGRLEEAPILFVSSNPSFFDLEIYPQLDWADDQIVDFFANRFGGGQREWLKDGTRTMLEAGGHSTGVKFLQAVRAGAGELLQSGDVIPGHDYAITEVVHCKSGGEAGVAEALMTCSGNYLDRVLRLSAAHVVVVLGRVAREILTLSLNVPAFEVNSVYGPAIVGERERLFVFLPHPNARSGRTFESWPPDQLELVRDFLQNQRAKDRA